VIQQLKVSSTSAIKSFEDRLGEIDYRWRSARKGIEARKEPKRAEMKEIKPD